MSRNRPDFWQILTINKNYIKLHKKLEILQEKLYTNTNVWYR